MKSRFVQGCLAAVFITASLPKISSAAIVAEWRFNDGVGGTAAASAGGFNGTLTNFDNLAAGAGNSGVSGWTSDGRLAFDGANDHVVTSFPLSSLSNTSFTLETIVSHDSPAQTWSPILGSSQADFNNIFFFGKQANGNTAHINFAGLTPTSINTGVVFADSQMHHLAVVFDDTANTLTLFKDYVQAFQATAVTGTLNTPSNLWIGAVGHAANERWNGFADHVRISNTALTPAQFVPEPTTGLLAMMGLLAIGARRRRCVQ